MARLALISTVALFALASAFALVLRYTPLFDERFTRSSSELSMGSLGQRFHQGAGPCLRYWTGRPASAEVTEVARAFFEVGLDSERTGKLIYQLLALAQAQERAAHPREEVDELLEVTREGMGPGLQVMFALKRDRVRAQLLRVLGPPLPHPSLVLSEEEQAVVDEQWARHPTVLVLPGMVDLVRHLQVVETEKRLDLLRERVAQRVSAGAAPAALGELGLAAGEEQDGWANPIQYEAGGGKVTLTSLGADRSPGGSGYDADLVREIPLGARSDAGVAPEADEAPPSEPAGEVTLSRAEVDGALEHLDQLSGAARVVPSFVGGKAVGFKFFAIRKGSLYQKVGLANGDTVTAIEGMPLTSPDKALEIYSKVRAAQKMELELERGGRRYAVQVRIR